MDIVCGVHGKCQVVIQSFLVFGQILGQCVFSQGNKRKLSSVGSAWPSRITASIKSFTFPSISIQRRSKFPRKVAMSEKLSV